MRRRLADITAGVRMGRDRSLIRGDLTAEAVSLTRVLRQLLPEEPEVIGPFPVLHARTRDSHHANPRPQTYAKA